MLFRSSADGGNTWSPLCGKYTKPGSPAQLPGEPLYDAYQNEWVQEEISLNDFLGQNILIRFHLVSDGFSEFDGFYFDDMQVLEVNNNGVGVLQPDASSLFLSQVVPNPVDHEAWVSYSNVAPGATLLVYDTYGRIVWKKSLNAGFGKASIPTENLAGGMYSYFIQLQDGSVSTVKKFVKN